MHISDKGLHDIMGHEGVRLVAYDDDTGTWTIGAGHIAGVRPGDTCTLDQAMAWLREDVGVAEAAIDRLVTVPLTQPQFDALVDFAFNVGMGAFAGSTLLKLLNAGDYDGADRQFGRWTMAGGRVLPGLVSRRAAERALFEGEETCPS